MAIIYSYPTIIPTTNDLVLGTDVDAAGKPTKNFTVQSIIDLVLTTNQTLAQVLTTGNDGGGQAMVGVGNITAVGVFSTFTGNLTGNVTGNLSGIHTFGSINGVVTGLTQPAGTANTTLATTEFVANRVDPSVLQYLGDATGPFDLNLALDDLLISGTTNQIETTAVAVNAGTNIGTIVLGFPAAGVTLPDGSLATTQATTDDSNKVATTKFVHDFSDVQDLDFTDGTASGSVILGGPNAQVFSVLGTADQVVTAAGAQTLTISLPATVIRNLQGNVTGILKDGSSIETTVTGITQTAGNDSTRIATTKYVDSAGGAKTLSYKDISATVKTMNLAADDLQFTGGSNITSTALAVASNIADIKFGLDNSIVLSGQVKADNFTTTLGVATWATTVLAGFTKITSVGVAPAGSPLLIPPGFVGNAAASLVPTPSNASTAQNVQFQGNASTANSLKIVGQVSITSSAAGGATAPGLTYTNGGPVVLISTIADSVVYNKELAGFNATNSSVGNGDSIIEALEKLQGQITNLPQGIVYQGIWNPGTSATSGGTPDLRLAANKINGHYYIVSTIGIGTPNGDGTTPNDWDVRDWCVFADDGAGGGADEWQKIDNSSLAGGTGTPNTITKWLTNQTIGNSSIEDTGSSGTGVVLADTVNFTTKGVNAFGNSISDTSSFTGAVTFAENINLTKGLGVWNGSAFVYGPISGTTKRVLTSGGAIGAPPTWEVPTVGTLTSVGLTETGDALTITNSPITTSGDINIAGAGNSTQYINGALDLVAFPTVDNYVDWKLQGDSGTNQSIIKQTIVDFAGGTKISTAVTTNATQKTLTINHVTQGNTNATATAAPAFGGTFTAISAVPVDTTGHLTGQTVKTITLPSPVNFVSGSAPGATAAVGTAGYVPAPAAGTGSASYFLNGLKGFTIPPNDDGVTAVTATAPIASTGGDTPVISHNNSGVTIGTYDSVTVDVKGHVTGGTNPGGSGGGIFSGDQAIPAAATATLAFTLTRATTGTLVFDVFLTSETSTSTSQAMKFTVAHSYNSNDRLVFNKVIDTGLDGTTGFTVEFSNSNTGATGTSVICEITSVGGVAQNIGYTVQVGHDSTNALTFTAAS